jgi:hypothetical protein
VRVMIPSRRPLAPDASARPLVRAGEAASWR